MAATQPASINHTIVLIAIGQGMVTGDMSDRRVLLMANAMLAKSNSTLLTEAEMQSIKEDLVCSGIIDCVNGTYRLLLNDSYKKKMPKTPAGWVDMIGSDRIHVYNKVLHAKLKIKVTTIINVDGKGNMQDPMGNIIPINLNALNRSLAAQYNVESTGDGGGGDKWIVDPDYHSDVDVNKKIVVRDYIKGKYL